MIIRELKVEIKQADVLHQIDCYEDSELYEEVVEEYLEMEPEMYRLCEPVVLMEYGIIGPELAREDVPLGTPVLMVLSSVGRGMSEYSTRAFSQGDYLKGMLADAMADSALFSLGKQLAPYLKEECGRLKMGIRRRLEAPQDIAMEAQKVVLDITGAREKCGIGISSGYMLDPVKSNAAIYLLTEDQEVFMHQHNCRNCNRLDCKGRNIPDIPVKVLDGENTYTLMVRERESILDALIKAKKGFAAVCGGTGKCGKCKIRLVDGYLPVTASDREIFTEEELKRGMRLACRAFPSEPVQVTLRFQEEAAFRVVTDYDMPVAEEVPMGAEAATSGTDRQVEEEISRNSVPAASCAVAVDIGTTTVALQLVDLQSRQVLASYTTVNHQRSFGADVISRIQAAIDGKGAQMQALIREDLLAGIRHLLEETGAAPASVKEVILAGNTTMGHLLMGYDCRGLGAYPFTPYEIGPVEADFREVFESDLLEARVKLLPGISAFVGGDIVSGLYACDVDQKAEYSLLVDLGTNGEIALGNGDRLLVTSTAAGPAFEGGNITFGVGSVEGAIAGVQIQDGQVKLQTIGGKAPVGICGTGVIEAVSELLKAGLMDETGCLDEEYFEEGFVLAEQGGSRILLTQQDVREIQLAKAAVRAGIETLLLRYGIDKGQVTHVYLAGGFGYKLDCDKAIHIGMIPEEFAGKIIPVGNSSLSGAVKCLRTEDGLERCRRIGALGEEINLSADKDFNQLYMEYMFFE